jgi:hypothetical protein
MKKIIFAIFAASLLFVQCDPEKEGQQSKKISKIYTQYPNEEKKLSEEWIWNGDNLSKINYTNSAWSLNFSYDNQDRVTKIYNSEIEASMSFVYNEKEIERIDMYEDTAFMGSIECDYTNGKISKMTFNIDLGFIEYMNMSKMLSLIIPHQAVKTLKAFAKQKAEQKTTLFIELDWNNDNIYKTELFIGIGAINLAMASTTYEYDNKKNPYENFIPQLLTGSMGFVKDGFISNANISKNNVSHAIISMVVEINPTSMEMEYEETEIEYSIKYDADYPVEVATKEVGSDNTYTTFYEYK